MPALRKAALQAPGDGALAGPGCDCRVEGTEAPREDDAGLLTLLGVKEG